MWRRRSSSLSGIRIHTIDIVQPPGIGISPIACIGGQPVGYAS
jgi:hypothetical protein